MPRGGFGGGGFGRGGFRGGIGRGGFGGRRIGPPLVVPMGGMGGMGGMGFGSPLLSALMVGGLGYVLGSTTGQPNPQQPTATPIYVVPSTPVPAPPPAIPAPTPALSAPPVPSQSASTGSSGAAGSAGATSDAQQDVLAQLKHLGELHAAGIITDEEFDRLKRRILNEEPPTRPR